MSAKNWDRDWDRTKLPYNEVRDYLSRSKPARTIESRFRIKLGPLNRELRKSHFIFFIDCSPSMGKYHDQVREAFLTYAELVQRMSIHDFEVVFSSKPRRLLKINNLARAKTAFDDQDWVEPRFKQGFKKFVNKSIDEGFLYRRYSRRRLSIFVLTDGKWGTEGISEIQQSVEGIISELDAPMDTPDVLLLQFMRFGDDSDSTLKLSSLVGLNVTTRRDIIVDTSRYDADIRQVLNGVVSRPGEGSVADFAMERTIMKRTIHLRPTLFQRILHLSGLAGWSLTLRNCIGRWFKGQGGRAGSALEDARETATPSRTRAHPKYQAYTLPLFVGGLLDTWGLGPSSPPMSTRPLRITRNCECGIKLAEGVSQLWPGGAERLDQSQPEPCDSGPHSFGQTLGAILARGQQALSATIEITCEAMKGLVPPKSNGIDSSLPLHNTNANRGGLTGPQNAQADTWLLLCIDKGPRRTSFRQELLLDINSDRALFDFLRDKYFAHRKFRSWFTLRSLQNLALTQFQIDANNYPDIMGHHQYCLQRDGGCDCIPPAGRVGEAREYRCSPAPAEPPRLVPVLTPERLTHYFLRPHECAVPQTYILEQLPKRTGLQLKAQSGRLAEGWGLHFQEGWHWASVGFIFALFTFIGIIFGVVWSAVTADVQSAFAVTGIFVALPALPLAFMFNRASS